MAKPKTVCLRVYTIKQACEQTGLAYETLKFYCNAGLVPGVRRDQNNHRVFTEDQIKWIQSLRCLRNCGLSIAEMREYTFLCEQGKATIPRRQEILAKKLEVLRAQKRALQESINFIGKKQKFYREVLAGERPYTAYKLDVPSNAQLILEAK